MDDLPILSSSTDDPEESLASYSSEYSYSEQEELYCMIVFVISRSSPISSYGSDLSVNHDDDAEASDIDDLIGINSDDGYESNKYSERDESNDINDSESRSDEHSIESDLDEDNQACDDDLLERSSYSKNSSSPISNSSSEEEAEEAEEEEETEEEEEEREDNSNTMRKEKEEES